MRTANFNAMPFGVHTGKNGEMGGTTLLAWPAGWANNPPERLKDAPAAYVSIAQCTISDEYSRGKGRKLARERGENGEGVFIQFPKYYDLKTKREMLYAMANLLDLRG